MNRSILIVICDFLLVSLLAFSTVDINKVADQQTPRGLNLQIKTNAAESGKDLAAVMRLALNDERQQRDRLLGELTRTRESAANRGNEVKSLLQELQTKEQESARLQEKATALQQERAALQQQTARAEQERSGLQQQFASAQTNIQVLSSELQKTSQESVASRDKLSELQAEIRKQMEQAAALQQQLGNLEHSNQLATVEKQQLAGRLQLVEAEKRFASEQVSRMQDEVKIEREEKAKLVEGVKSLATQSGQLVQEIRENRPQTPNTIFSDFMTNRVRARFTAFRPGLISSTKKSQSETVLVSDGTNVFALCHVQDTPLSLSQPGTDWDGLAGSLERNGVEYPITSLSFYFEDPRIALMPLSDAQARALGCRVYQISSDPYKFQDAVLVGAAEGYYGECRFQIDATAAEYFKLDHSVLRGLFGHFNPSKGDLVFSKSGELLGIMANNTYCLRMRDFSPAATLRFGQDVKAQKTGNLLARLYGLILNKPARLQ